MVTDFNSPRIVSAYDELPLWSAMFGLLLLKHVPLENVRRGRTVPRSIDCARTSNIGPPSNVSEICWKAQASRS